MSEQKRFTAQEMRELSNRIWDYEKMSSGLELTINNENYVDCEATQNLIAMLRQAADAEEENTKLRETVNSDSASMAGKDAVIAQLKERLEAVVKECEDMRKYSAFALVDPEDFDVILRAARGEESEVK